MSNFLWIEDFGGGDNVTRATTNALFGSFLESQGVLISALPEEPRVLREQLKQQGVFLELNYYDGHKFISNHLEKVDFIVLDIDLPCDEGYLEDYENIEVFSILVDTGYLDNQDYEDEQKINTAKYEFKKIAGYHLYTKLIYDLGFPKENILFCSNHGDELKTIQEAFVKAKMPLPRIHTKSQTKELQKQVQEYANNPYTCLRRSILMASDKLQGELNKKKHIARSSPQWNFDQKTYQSGYFSKYLSLLEQVLPIIEPKNKAYCYTLLVRSLVHNWDQNAEKVEKQENKALYSLITTLNHCRNWSAHSREILQNPPIELIAYLFLIHMRATFKMGMEFEPYELKLLSLFKDPLSQQEMDEKKTNLNETLEGFYKGIVYLSDGNAYDYDKMVNFLQKEAKLSLPNDEKSDVFFEKCIYRMLWFILAQKTSSGNFNYPNLNSSKSDLDIFINNIERYVYTLSFPH